MNYLPDIIYVAYILTSVGLVGGWMGNITHGWIAIGGKPLWQILLFQLPLIVMLAYLIVATTTMLVAGEMIWFAVLFTMVNLSLVFWTHGKVTE
jgi:hypothetical protein